MNATKRKFNALIQGIGTRSTPQTPISDAASENHHVPEGRLSTSSARSQFSSTIRSIGNTDDNMAPSGAVPVSAITQDFLNKRRRVGALGSTNESAGLGKTTISNVILRKWTPGGKSSDKEKQLDAPRYCPGDRDQLIRRLGTFQELTEWTPKPDTVNEIEWAKRGWMCVGKERVRCTLCNKELVVKVNTREEEGKEVSVLVPSEIEEALVKKFAELILDAHQDGCLWRKRGCDDSLLRLSLASPQTALPSLRQRYDELCARPAFLPYLFNLRLPPTFSLETVKSQLAPKFFTDPPPPSSSSNSKTVSSSPAQIEDVALALALTGWQGLTNPRIGPVPNSASCATCLRRLGLWMFKSREVDEATGEIFVPAPMDHLDPVREHRFFCPWRNAATQRNPGSRAAESEDKPAWEIVQATVRNAAYLRGQVNKSPGKAHGRSRSSILPSRTPSTPKTPRLSGEGNAPDLMSPDGADEDEDEGARAAKDKERWARLRRVKSLFNTKNGKKLQRMATGSSRPGTPGTPGRPDTARTGVTSARTSFAQGE